MAVAAYVRNGHKQQRGFPAPKRAGEYKYWYRAARKVIPDIPPYECVTGQTADVASIHFTGTDKTGPYDVYIARKRNIW